MTNKPNVSVPNNSSATLDSRPSTPNNTPATSRPSTPIGRYGLFSGIGYGVLIEPNSANVSLQDDDDTNLTGNSSQLINK